MTSASLSRRLALLATFAALLGLVSCGSGGGSGGQTNVRAINLTTDLASLDIYLGGTKQFSALASGAVSNSLSLDANTYTVNVNSAGNASNLFTGSYSLTKDAHYTAVVWGPQASLRVTALPEDDDTSVITSGNAKIRVLNATTETGALDVYLTAPGADLSAASPIQGNLPSGSLAGYKDIAATGTTYQLRVTSQGNPKDVRLDIGSVSLTAAKYQTLVLTAGTGGTLINGQLIVNQGAATSLVNSQARVRFAASVDSGGAVTVAVGGTALSPGGLVATAQGFYTSVTAGNAALTTTVNGVKLLTTPQAITLASGTDYTLLVYGSPANPQVVTIVDDNRLPSISGRTKIRVVNGVAGLGALSMSVDNVAPLETSFVVAGTGSAYAQLASNSSSNISVGTATLPAIYASTRPPGDLLTSQSVYTVFVLSGGAKPQGFLLKDTP